MKAKLTLVAFLTILLIQVPALGSDPEAVLELKLEKGDVLRYEIRGVSEGRYPVNGNPQVIKTRIVNRKTLLSLEVLDIPKPGVYLFNYKHEFTRYSSDYGDRIEISDSRFPVYGRDFRTMIRAYLSSIEYSILLNTHEGQLKIDKLDEIREGLSDHLRSRGLKIDQHIKSECAYLTGEEQLLQGLDIFNFYPGTGTKSRWTNTHPDGNKEHFRITGVSDSRIRIYARIPEFIKQASQRSHRLPREIILDSETGILLEARSIRSKESELNFLYEAELLSHSRWKPATILCGTLSEKGIKQLCLVNRSSSFGDAKNYSYLNTDEEGSFHVELNIDHPIRYRLYLLESFPVSTNKNVELYLEPGDSIHVEIDPDQTNISKYSGKGYNNSAFLNQDILLNRNLKALLRLKHIFFPPERALSDLDPAREKIAAARNELERDKNSLSKSFIDLMHAEIYAMEGLLHIAEASVKLTEAQKEGRLDELSYTKLPPPRTPVHEYPENLELYPSYITQFVGFHFRQLRLINENRLVNIYSSDTELLAFTRTLLNAYPVYENLVSALEELASVMRLSISKFRIHFEEFLESSNNLEASAYVQGIYEQADALQVGKEMPQMELLDLDGHEFDWDRARGKVVVLGLFEDYGSAHFLCEDLYKEYGSNRGDVIFLRISPGNSFEAWKAYNIRYSEEYHQMYYTGGEKTFREQFRSLQLNTVSGFLLIDRSGKIYRQSSFSNIKPAIKAALALPGPPKKPFMETLLAKILLISLASFLVLQLLNRVRLNRKRKKQALESLMAQLEQKAMMAQLNPHFLFNSLNSIQNLIRRKQLKDAESYLTRFAVLVRKILEHSERTSISISEELDALELYLDLEQMRFDFAYETIIHPEIDIHNTMIPSMMLQPIVENAVLHGLAPKTGEKRLSLELTPEEDMLLFRVEDNGIGRAEASKIPGEHTGKGLQLIESRIEILNRTDPGKYLLRITDLEDHGEDSGTRAELLMPDER